MDRWRLQAGSDGRKGAPKVSHIPTDLLLSRLQGVKKTKSGWDALGSAHDDHKPSLGIAVAQDGAVLLKCRLQDCSADAICKAVGLTLGDLSPSQNGKPQSEHR
jgi:hypothetical protein